MNKFIHGNNLSGQSIVDRALAARYTVSGQSLAKVICKATTEELMSPKRKHLDYLLQCTNEPNVSIPQMANLLIDRTQNSSWVVVFKALVTTHNLMNYGNERFTQYLASNHSSFHLTNFTDNANNQSYEMSGFIRRHSKYLNEKAVSYRQMAFDFCKVKRGKEDGLLRTMDTDKLLKCLPVLQVQLDTLVEFNVSPRDLSNGVINSAFLLLFKDLIRLFACYNDGIINLLEKYFEMNKRHCKEGLEIYTRFLARMDRVCEVLKVAENIGIDKGDIPDLAKAPSSLLEALEQHLVSMENNKKTTITTNQKAGAGMTAVINSYAAASQAANAPAAGADEITEDERDKILQEEQRQLDLLKKERLKQMSPAGSSTSSTASAKAATTTNTNDPFAPLPTSTTVVAAGATTAATAVPASSHLNDLLSLNDTSTFKQPIFPPQQQSTSWFAQQPQQPFLQQQQQSFIQQQQQQNLFGAPNAFQSAFPTQQQSTLNPFLPQQPIFPPQQLPLIPQQQQQQQQSAWISPTTSNNHSQLDFGSAFNPPMQPSNTPKHPSNTTTNHLTTKLIQSDLDSSLASLAGNLNFSPVGQIKKTEHQWTGGGTEKKLTGGNQGNWGFPPSTTNNWTAPYGTAASGGMNTGVQRSTQMSPFQSQSRPMTQAGGAIWGSTPHLQTTNQPNPLTSTDQSTDC